jgi:hypothetical protein
MIASQTPWPSATSALRGGAQKARIRRSLLAGHDPASDRPGPSHCPQPIVGLARRRFPATLASAYNGTIMSSPQSARMPDGTAPGTVRVAGPALERFEQFSFASARLAHPVYYAGDYRSPPLLLLTGTCAREWGGPGLTDSLEFGILLLSWFLLFGFSVYLHTAARSDAYAAEGSELMLREAPFELLR